MGGDSLITSKDIIEKTGISRATLNNYIKMGILPKPIVRRPGPEQKGVKQIGFFPISVLESILKVKLLKQQGNSMDDIARLFQGGSSDILTDKRQISTPSESDQPIDKGKKSTSLHHDPLAGKAQKSTPPHSDLLAAKTSRTTPADDDRRQYSIFDISKSHRRVTDHNFQVTISDISSPAYLVNHNFEIEWVNKAAEINIFKRNIKEIFDLESRNVFKLLLREDLRGELHSWKGMVQLHLSILQNRITHDSLNSLYRGVTPDEAEILADLYGRKIPAAKENIYNIPLSLIKSDGLEVPYQVYSMSFREGTFFVYIPSDGISNALMEMLSQRGRVINDLMKNRLPSLVSLCVLIADLQNSVKISAELLPAQYFELINELWQYVTPSFEKYHGIYGKHAGDGMLYYFIQKPETNYLMNAVKCSLEIREIMKELSSKWRLRKGWDNELFLNIGLNEGQEFFGTIHSASNIEFTALGDTINIAGRLSDFAQNGEIWTTKNLISRLSQEERNLIRFGVHQENQSRRVFIRNSFSRISDIMKESNPHFSHLSAIAGLPITEIKEKVHLNSGIKIS